MSNPTENGLPIPERFIDLLNYVGGNTPPEPTLPDGMDDDSDEWMDMLTHHEWVVWDIFDDALNEPQWTGLKDYYDHYQEVKQTGELGDLPDLDTWLSNCFNGSYSFSI